MSNFPPDLTHTYELDKKHLESTKVPILTVSASYKEDVKGFYGLPENEELKDIVFSRAHYSMALGTAMEAWQGQMNPQKAWIVDPTNYVSQDQWKKIQFTEFVGKTLARNSILKILKDFVDKFGRNKLPILGSITPPLQYLTQDINGPILSFHIAAGNILIENGKKVIQVITDPHVRDDYLNHADSENMFFCVFDDRTKTEFLEKAALKGMKADPERVIVTGPPIDPRIINARFNKKAPSKRPLQICITTGGLGTNKEEIDTLLDQLLPELRKRPSDYRVLIYAGTQLDIAEMVKNKAKQARVAIEPLSNKTADLRLIYHPQIVDANEMLIQYGFPWADGFVTKPSGDMGYDAVAAGCFLLTLREWGEWEHNIRVIFEQKNISRPVVLNNFVKQLEVLNHKDQHGSWVESAMCNALEIDSLFLEGSKNILKAVKQVGK